MRESASRGFYLSSRAPYGYRKIKVRDGLKEHTKLEIDEFQSRVLASIFDEVVGGKGLMEVVKGLNSRGITGPKGKGWAKTSLRKMLGNEVYTGAIVWGRHSKRGLQPIRMENACPAIVDRETFQQAQNFMSQRAFARLHPRRVSSQYLLSGLARCGYCEKALIGMEAKSGAFSYYVCGTLTKKGAGSCPSHYLNSRKLESLVVDKIKAHVLTPENLTSLAELVSDELNSNSATYCEELCTIENEVTDVSRRLERVYDAIETGKIALDDLGPRLHELKDRMERLQARKDGLRLSLTGQTAEVSTREEVAECAADLRSMLETSSLSERKAFIRSFVKEVRITGDDVLVTYTLPMLPAGATEERLPVLAIVHYGGQKVNKM